MSKSSSSSDIDGDEVLLNIDVDEVDYYAILNVSKEATAEEINKAYKQKCLIFHPDRHMDPIDKEAAEKYFVVLMKAHTTLVDPKLRSIYDAVGVQGLQLHGWEVIPQTKDAENIRLEYEFLKRLQDTEIMFQRVHPSGVFSCKLFLAGLFNADPQYRCSPHLIGMGITQGVNCNLTANDKIGLFGRLKVENGEGDGAFTLNWKRAMSALSVMETSLTFSSDSITLSANMIRSIFTKSALMVQPSLQYFPLQTYFNPGCTFIYNRSLNQRCQGAISYHLGLVQSLTTSFIYTELNQPKFIGNLTISPINSHVRFSYIKRSSEHDNALEASFIASSVGQLAPSISYERRLSRYSRIGCSLSLTIPTFLLNAKFKIKTGATVYEFKLLLCESDEDITRATLFGVVLPCAAYFLSKMVFRKAYDRFMSIFEDSSEDREVNIVKREDASNIVNLMRPTADKVSREENMKNGLIIMEAKYGHMIGSIAYPILGERVIDVTIPLQAMVNDSQLRLYSSKVQLPGFYDPCPLEPKMLRISYKYRNNMHLVSVPDEIALHIPNRAHRVSTDY